MNLKLVKYNGNENWDELVSNSPQENVFCLSWFLNSLKVDVDLWVVHNDNIPVIGAVVLREGDTVLTSPRPLTMYQGIVFTKHFQEMPAHRRISFGLEYTEFLIKELSGIYNKISFCLHHSVEDLRSFSWFNYKLKAAEKFVTKLFYTGIIDLSRFNSFDEFLKTIRTVRQQEYKKGIASGFRTELSTDINLLNDLEDKTFAKHDISRDVKEISLLAGITKAAIDTHNGSILLAKNSKNEVMSASLFLYDSKTGYYLVAANDPEFRKSGSSTFLLLENIRQCFEKGLKAIDLVGINSPNRGAFKTSFNALPIPYFHVNWTNTSNRL